MENQFTKGDWQSSESSSWLRDEENCELEVVYIFAEIDDVNREIGFVSFDRVTRKEGEANVNLFKNAKNLLEALQEFVELSDKAHWNNRDNEYGEICKKAKLILKNIIPEEDGK